MGACCFFPAWNHSDLWLDGWISWLMPWPFWSLFCTAVICASVILIKRSLDSTQPLDESRTRQEGLKDQEFIQRIVTKIPSLSTPAKQAKSTSDEWYALIHLSTAPKVGLDFDKAVPDPFEGDKDQIPSYPVCSLRCHPNRNMTGVKSVDRLLWPNGHMNQLLDSTSSNSLKFYQREHRTPCLATKGISCSCNWFDPKFPSAFALGEKPI